MGVYMGDTCQRYSDNNNDNYYYYHCYYNNNDYNDNAVENKVAMQLANAGPKEHLERPPKTRRKKSLVNADADVGTKGNGFIKRLKE